MELRKRTVRGGHLAHCHQFFDTVGRMTRRDPACRKICFSYPRHSLFENMK